MDHFHPSICRHLDFFLFLAIMHSVAMGIPWQVYVWICVSVFNYFGSTPRNGISGSHGNFMFNFVVLLWYWCLNSGACTC
jgi:hypothetical protein